MHVAGILCDLAKVLDYENHEILLVQLQFYWIRHAAEDWFRCCVRNRRQKVEVTSPNSTKNLFSACSTLKHWVPQGSILMPLLFIIYIDDLPLRINSVSESVLFAHDSSVIIWSRNFDDFCSMSNSVFSCVIKLFAANNFVLNEYNEIHNKQFITFYITYWL
jgi:hypothetical protein